MKNNIAGDTFHVKGDSNCLRCYPYVWGVNLFPIFRYTLYAKSIVVLRSLKEKPRRVSPVLLPPAATWHSVVGGRPAQVGRYRVEVRRRSGEDPRFGVVALRFRPRRLCSRRGAKVLRNLCLGQVFPLL
jgi:hypothetical protein